MFAHIVNIYTYEYLCMHLFDTYIHSYFQQPIFLFSFYKFQRLSSIFNRKYSSFALLTQKIKRCLQKAPTCGNTVIVSKVGSCYFSFFRAHSAFLLALFCWSKTLRELKTRSAHKYTHTHINSKYVCMYVCTKVKLLRSIYRATDVVESDDTYSILVRLVYVVLWVRLLLPLSPSLSPSPLQALCRTHYCLINACNCRTMTKSEQKAEQITRFKSNLYTYVCMCTITKLQK